MLKLMVVCVNVLPSSLALSLASPLFLFIGCLSRRGVIMWNSAAGGDLWMEDGMQQAERIKGEMGALI